jgi:lysine-N-methylase
MTTIRKRAALTPQYMNDFSCIGSECEDTCCIGWNVSVDKSTYKRYKKSRNFELKTLFDKKISRNRSKSSEVDYAKIKMEKDLSCPFLTEEKLCNIHANLGEEFLSNTCATYPRSTNRINGVVERSATMSCPEAARLALLNPKGIQFDEIEESGDTQGFISKELHTEDDKLEGKPQRYFWELRIFTIQVLQNRGYTMEDRLIILGIFYQKVQGEIDKGLIQNVPDLIASYTNLIESGAFLEELSRISSNPLIQMKLTKALIDNRFQQSGVNSKRFLECLEACLAGLEYTHDASSDELIERYLDAHKHYYSLFMDKHEYIFENYLVNHVFKNLFPFGQKSIYEDYVMMINHYAMIKLLLIGMARYYKDLKVDHVIKLIQSFSKTIEHNSIFLRNILKILQEEEYTSMAYMVTLIKS